MYLQKAVPVSDITHERKEELPTTVTAETEENRNVNKDSSLSMLSENKRNFLKCILVFTGFHIELLFTFTENDCDACSRNHHLVIIVESLRATTKKLLLVKEKVERKLGNKC